MGIIGFIFKAWFGWFFVNKVTYELNRILSNLKNDFQKRVDYYCNFLEENYLPVCDYVADTFTIQ